MAEEHNEYDISDEDLRAALREIRTYVDVTEEDLRKIYAIALRHAKQRMSSGTPVRDVMSKNVVSVKGDSDIYEVSRLLSENRVSGLPVVDEENRVIGVLSEADLLHMAGIEKGHSFRDIFKHLLGEPFPKHRAGSRVRDIMTSPAITTTPGADIREVAVMLDEKRIKRLPVVDENNKLIGIISRGDIIRVLAK
ncbi:MAG: CBS domain-containing protein [Nitrospirota bacterium]|mgnify:CR=1 FL=1